MSREAIDPAPRKYPSSVTLLRRGTFDRSSIGPQDVAEIERWLLDEAADETDLLELVLGFVWRLVAAGLPLDRASLHVGTLHPQFYGYAWNWNRDDGFVDEVQVSEAVLATDAYRKNPIFRVIEYGEFIRQRTDGPEAPEAGTLLSDLKKQGIIEYAAVPLRTGGIQHNASTIATKQAGGFTEGQFAALTRLLRLLALHVARHIAMQIARNVVDTYLGEAAGGEVLEGSIKRGSGPGHRRGDLGLGPARLHRSRRPPWRPRHAGGVERLFRMPGRRRPGTKRRSPEVHRGRPAGGLSLR